MMDLISINDQVYVWNADDWLTLRAEHRMVGNLIGTLSCLPRQDIFLGLPMLLMPEEVRLLLDKKLARVVKCDSMTELPRSDLREKFELFRKKSYDEQVEYYQAERKKQITNMVDIIIEGKRRKLMGLPTKKLKRKKKNESTDEAGSLKVTKPDLPDRDAIIKQEFDKIVAITPEMALIQIPTECPWVKSGEMEREEIEFKFPETPNEMLRSKVFSDLWAKGYYVTTGTKFGGNFLVYPGDPLKFHAQHIVVCREAHEAMRASEMVALSRLGTSVKKTVVIASLVHTEDSADPTLAYNTLKWTPL